MPDFMEIFDPPQKQNKNMRMAMFLRMLAELMDEGEDQQESSQDDDRTPGVRVRSHFQPG